MLSRATAVVAALACAGTASADNIARAFYEDPTSRYAHGVLGDDIEYGSLILETDGGTRYRLELPFERVFEDTAPRLFDVDGDGENEVIVVESHSGLGARLAIYDTETRVSVTSYIGQPFRWLAPVGIGAADLDGDGVIELAFVDVINRGPWKTSTGGDRYRRGLYTFFQRTSSGSSAGRNVATTE